MHLILKGWFNTAVSCRNNDDNNISGIYSLTGKKK